MTPTAGDKRHGEQTNFPVRLEAARSQWLENHDPALGEMVRAEKKAAARKGASSLLACFGRVVQTPVLPQESAPEEEEEGHSEPQGKMSPGELAAHEIATQGEGKSPPRSTQQHQHLQYGAVLDPNEEDVNMQYKEELTDAAVLATFDPEGDLWAKQEN
jgi:hypothetical protein